MTVDDPEWTDDDRDWHMASVAEDENTCKGCGQPLDLVATDDLREGPKRVHVEASSAWCLGCREREQHDEQVRQDDYSRAGHRSVVDARERDG